MRGETMSVYRDKKLVANEIADIMEKKIDFNIPRIQIQLLNRYETSDLFIRKLIEKYAKAYEHISIVGDDVVFG